MVLEKKGEGSKTGVEKGKGGPTALCIIWGGEEGKEKEGKM